MDAGPACPSCSSQLNGDRGPLCAAAARAGVFRVISVLAQSPHGRTYRAQGPSGMVALKELVFALVPTAQQLDAFEREARLLGSVSHPQIPRLIDSFREGDGPSLRLYLAQELVDGEPLSSRIGLDESQSRFISRHLLHILRFRHDRLLDHLNVSPGFRAFLARMTARKRASRPASAVEALLALDAPAPRNRPVQARLPLVVAAIVVLASIILPWIAIRKVMTTLSERPGANAERARRAQLEALERELTQPSKPVTPPPPPKSDHRDISLGRLLSGAKLIEIDPELPSCYQQAGIELARLRVWPGMKAMQLKLVLHSQDVACEWLPLEVRASADGGRALRSSGTMGETPRDGWRDVLYNFELPLGVDVVRLDLASRTRPLESWRIDLERREVHRVGYAIAGRVDAPFARVPTPTGCARLERGAFEKLWIEQAPRKQLLAQAAFATRKDTKEPCPQESRLLLLNSRSSGSTARLDDRTVTFTLPLPEGRDRLRVALGGSSRPAAILRIDLQGATAEREALAAVTP